MKKIAFLSILVLFSVACIFSSFRYNEPAPYMLHYKGHIADFRNSQVQLLELIRNTDLSENNKTIIRDRIRQNRMMLKEIDFWVRYFEPIAYKKINGPLPVEWETEVFEKWEAPYKREGAGLTLAMLYLDEKDINKDSLIHLINASVKATDVYLADSITSQLAGHDHFFMANRLFLLNLASIYTTGYECPNPEDIIPELLHMLKSVSNLYHEFNNYFPAYTLNKDYIKKYEEMLGFVASQNKDFSRFDHFRFIRDHVNPLYRLNHAMILDYKVRSASFNDFSLNKQAASIFDKALFRGQNKKGVFIGITDESQLKELEEAGRLLFYDPILSQNNRRSCASCHQPGNFFADTIVANKHLDQQQSLTRNTPSLVNAVHNHLLMLDGKHINLEDQARGVITNPQEMGSDEAEVLKKIMSCEQYKTVFKKYLAATPQYQSVQLEHIASAMMLYYSGLSSYYAPFDNAMEHRNDLDNAAIRGFNLFMGKAQCGTCHFVPQFNGVKPPYTGSEFEVLGVPADRNFTSISTDKGRYAINPAKETHSAFRTNTVRNTAFTAPYMHNGVFRTLEEVIDFYDAGGGAGKGLDVPNQTLSSDSLRLTLNEKKDIIAFIHSLTEEIPKQEIPAKLPTSKNKVINNRIPGGEY